MTDTAALNKKLLMSGKKIGYFCEKLGLSYECFRQKRYNEVEFKASEIDKLCTELGIESLEERMAIFFAPYVER